jgi:hypothetical protein
MGLIDSAFAPLRQVLGTAEREMAKHSPLDEIAEIDDKILDGIEAVRHATESIERHVEVIETLADTLPALTASVTRLTDQIGELLKMTAPIVEAEEDISRVTHFFSRHRHDDEPAPAGDPGEPGS